MTDKCALAKRNVLSQESIEFSALANKRCNTAPPLLHYEYPLSASMVTGGRIVRILAKNTKTVLTVLCRRGGPG